jgi:hypothetical protein
MQSIILIFLYNKVQEFGWRALGSSRDTFRAIEREHLDLWSDLAAARLKFLAHTSTVSFQENKTSNLHRARQGRPYYSSLKGFLVVPDAYSRRFSSRRRKARELRSRRPTDYDQ